MKGLDVVAIADAVQGSDTPQAAWDRLAATLKRHGLVRTALHADLPFAAPNPFADDAGGRRFGHVWNAAHDRRLRGYRGDIRTASDPDLRHIRPTLRYLGLSRSPLWIEHQKVLERPAPTAFAPLCRIMVEAFGQHQALALPLGDPASGRISMLSVWGDEPRPELPEFIRLNLRALHMAGLYFYGMLRARWPERPAETPLPALSRRERETLALASQGALTAEIAYRLRISERSVHEYMLRARRKLGARSRSEAIARAVLHGIVAP